MGIASSSLLKRSTLVERARYSERVIRAHSYAVWFVYVALALFLVPSLATAQTSTTTNTALYAEVVRGDISSVVRCYPSGYAFTIAGNTSKTYLFRAGFTNSYPSSAVPVLNQTVFVVVGSAATCDTDPTETETLVSGRTVTYFSVSIEDVLPTLPGATSTPATAPQTGGQSSSGSGSSSGDGFISKIQSLLNNILRPPSSSGTGTGSGSGGSSSGGSVSPTNFGGLIGTPIPCDPIQSTPPGPGTFLIPVGPPLAGPYMYVPPPGSVDYLCLPPPLASGQWTIGSQTPGGICDIHLSPETYRPVPTVGIMNPAPGHGTSGCAPQSEAPAQKPPTGDCTAAICEAAKAYIGTDTSAGPGDYRNGVYKGGLLACAWAVNNVLSNAGVPKIDGDSVKLMDNALRSGRGTQVSQADAKCGDIVTLVNKLRSTGRLANHTGICLNDGCTEVISNSSSAARFIWKSGPDFGPYYKSGPGNIYRVTCPK